MITNIDKILGQYCPENHNKRYIGNKHGPYCYDTNNHMIYYIDTKINWLNPNTVELINDQFIKDSQWVYWRGILLDWINPKEFQDLGGGYLRDINSIYFNTKKVEWADLKSFSVLTDEYAKDTYSVFWEWRKIEWADPKTFEILEHLASMFDDSYTFSRDAYHIYFKDEIKNFEDEDFDKWLMEKDKK